MNISIYTLTSQLHDEKAVDAATAEFLGSLNIKFDFIGSDFTTYGDHALNLIYVRTGGTEGGAAWAIGQGTACPCRRGSRPRS